MPLTSDGASQESKLKKDRACDACRRRKTKCDGSSMHNNVCSNCIQSRKPCTYVEASRPRGPPKAYITSLEDRVEALEALLQQIRPDQDFSEELGPPIIRGSWKHQDGSLDAPSTSSRRKSPITSNILPPLLIPYRNGKSDDPSPNQLSHAFESPRSTHLIFQSKLPSKRMRMRVGFDEDLSSSSEETSGSASSSEQVEQAVITSLVGREKITLFSSENDDTPEENNIRFHGRSSTAGLIETTRQFKHMHIRDAVNSPEPEEKSTPVFPDNLTVAQWRRPIFWKRATWEYSHETQLAKSLDRLQTFLEYFPSPDLADTLIDLYFRNSNLIFPLLHRPTFNRQWKEQLHHRNIWFAGVCLMAFAIGSRWCNDERTLPVPSSGEDSKIDWRRAGRQYFEIVVEIHRIRQSWLYPTTLFEVQTIILMGMYLRSTAVFPTAWVVISVGLRKVQDVGAHRKKVYRAEPNIDDELWKRAFWLLVVFDRIGCASLGRACGISEEDFDLDLPLEVDDDYWQPGYETFKQPAGVPSTITAFNQLIKLTQIMAFTMRTLYAINKSKIYDGAIPKDQQIITKQISMAMTEWLGHLPEHLRWHDKIENPAYFAQSASLITLYHLTQMLIWRPLIAIPHPHSSNPASSQYSADFPSIPSLTDPAIIRCTEAARACARIVDVQLRHGIALFYIPGIINVSYVCAGLLILNAWNLKIREKEIVKAAIPDIKPPLTSRIEQDITCAKTFLHALEAVKDHWDIADVLLEELTDSLTGLETQPSNNDVSDSSDLRKSRSRSSIRNHQINTDAHCALDDNERSNYPQPSSSNEDSYHPTRFRYHSHGTSHTFQDSDPGVHIRTSDAYPALDTRRATETRSPRSSSVAINEHPSINSPTSVNPASWRERGIPYISSMRRASSSSLRAQDPLHLLQDKEMPNSRTALRPPESAVRYDDDVNVHPDDRMRRSTTPHLQEGSHQHGPYGLSRSSYDRSSYERAQHQYVPGSHLNVPRP